MVHRVRGTLDSLTDDEKRSLRPIGMSVREAAGRTGQLLDRLSGAPGVDLFAGVRVTRRAPRIGFAVCTASQLLLVESVAWPSGAYTVTSQGYVLCDGTYIGQSVQALLGSVRLLRRAVHRRRIAAIVVVHPCDEGRPSLPAVSPAGPVWLSPDEVHLHIARRLFLRRRKVIYCQKDINPWYRRRYRWSQTEG
jgi:hypothetical protein